MLSLAKLSVGGEDYYLEVVASGLEEYYTGAAEAPGVWIGSACADLGLAGTVAPDDLRAVLNAITPGGGTPLFGTIALHPRRVCGIDLCFSAPKSVSVLWGLGCEETSTAVRHAHDEAVRDAIGYLEAHAAYARRGSGGSETVPTSGLLAAAFRHRTSRAGDPQLHTHVVVANAVQAEDGRWSALYHALVFYHGRTAGFVYQASLRAGLARGLGVSFGPITLGAAEIAGVPTRLLNAFSNRRAEIEARLAELGGDSRRMREIAALETRPAKAELPQALEAGRPDLLREAWSAQARAHHFEPDRLGALTGSGREPVVTERDRDELGRDLLGASGLTMNESVFERRDVVRAVAERLPDGGRLELVEELVDEVLADPTVVSFERKGKGGEPLSSTKDLLAIEWRLVERALAAKGGFAGVAPASVVDEVIAERSLSGEQQAMVRRVTSSGDGVEIVVGKAGAGKTYALDAARAAWQRAGLTVQGAALSARAAAELESGAGIDSITLARLTDSLMCGETSLTSGDVVVVDEAGMVGSRTLGILIAEADRARAKLVLVGDHRQLPEIEAGGAFRVLAESLGASRLEENRRQTAAWEHQALDQLRAGRAGEALVAYVEHDRVHLHDSTGAARAALVAGWLEARSSGADAQMYAFRRSDVEDLNLLARDALARQGALGDELAEGAGRLFATGDEVLFLRNDRRMGVTNGLRGKLTGANEDGLVVLTTKGERVVPLDYVEDGHLAHGYATTVHKSQGATVERAFVLGTEAIYREAGYVAMSRAKEGSDLYVNSRELHQMGAKAQVA